MELRVLRRPAHGDSLGGDLFRDGQRVCVTLENRERAIPNGRYTITLTESARVRAGSLWSPREDHKLPLIQDVPGRDGIRIHAANHHTQLEGCIAVGYVRDGDGIASSRAALENVLANWAEPAWITVEDATVLA